MGDYEQARRDLASAHKRLATVEDSNVHLHKKIMDLRTHINDLSNMLSVAQADATDFEKQRDRLADELETALKDRDNWRGSYSRLVSASSRPTVQDIGDDIADIMREDMADSRRHYRSARYGEETYPQMIFPQ